MKLRQCCDCFTMNSFARPLIQILFHGQQQEGSPTQTAQLLLNSNRIYKISPNFVRIITVRWVYNIVYMQLGSKLLTEFQTATNSKHT